MDSTPKKLGVHWDLDASMSDFGSPLSQASTDSTTSTSSLQYINAQLVAHGFIKPPGISLDGLSKEDFDRAVKCFLGMLSQRVDDMSRSEEFATKIRTLTYEHERLLSLHKTAKDKAATAEREANTHKSRLASLTQTLQATENAHKRTTGELQRLRSTLQGLRDTHKAEIRKIEKEKDKMAEKWNKLADTQLRLGSNCPSGIRFSNMQVVEASDVQMRGDGKGLLDLALEEAEHSRDAFASENRVLRGLILTAANSLQRTLHSAKNLTMSETRDEPAPLTIPTLFPMSPADAASAKITSLLSSVKELAEKLASENTISRVSPIQTTLSTKKQLRPEDQDEVDRLHEVVRTLRSELEEVKKAAHQSQALVDQMSVNQCLVVDPTSALSRDAERERLDKRSKDLEEESRRFNEAAIRLGKEKTAFETERIKFLEEKRSWQVQTMLSEVPQSYGAGPSSIPMAPNDIESDTLPLKRSSPRKSTHRVKSSSNVLRGPSPKKTRVSRRSSSLILSPLSPKSKASNTLGSPRRNKVIPAFETEVIPSILLEKPADPPEFKTRMDSNDFRALPPMSEAFVLPPPSPGAKLPAPGSFLDVGRSQAPLPSLNLVGTATTRSQEHVQDLSSGSSSSSSSSSTLSVQPVSQPLAAIPITPVARKPSFPIAKPFAQHMIHAYSPVKPSPLSRILMMANTPSDDGNRSNEGLSVLREENDSLDIPPMPLLSLPVPVASEHELGAQHESADGEGEEDEGPIQRGDKHRRPQEAAARVRTKSGSTVHNATRVKAKSSSSQKLRTEHGRVVPTKKTVPAALVAPPRDRASTTTKTRSSHSTGTTTNLKARAAPEDVEKENRKRKKVSPDSEATSSSSSSSSSTGSGSKKSATRQLGPPDGLTKPATKGTGISTLKPVLKKGGARRVPIDSAEAAPSGFARRS